MKTNICLIVALSTMLSLGAATAWANTDASERRFIREGMSEAEVLQKIGKPDYKTAAGSDTSTTVRGRSGGKSTGKTGTGKGGRTSKSSKSSKSARSGKSGKIWAYRPHPTDPQTLTLITIAQGQVVRVERKVER